MSADVLKNSEEILLVKEFGHSLYCCGDCIMSMKLAEKTLEELKKGGKAAFVSKFVARKMHMKDCHVFLGLEGCIQIFAKDLKYVSNVRAVREFKNWQEQNHPNVKRITLIVAPPLQEEFMEELEKFFPSESGVQILPAEFPDAKDGLWFWSESALWWTRTKKKWEFREWCRKFLKNRWHSAYEKIFI